MQSSLYNLRTSSVYYLFTCLETRLWTKLVLIIHRRPVYIRGVVMMHKM